MNIHASIPCARICGKPKPKQATNGSVYYNLRFEHNQNKYDAQIFEDSPAFEKFEKMHLELNDYVDMQATFKTKAKKSKREVVVQGEKIVIEVPVKLDYFSILDIDFSIPKEIADIAAKNRKNPVTTSKNLTPITDLGGFYEGGD